ncbi:MAG: glycoside hydrolase family 127 protein, partial [Clostridiales bacterium]|nr:glycoside hydrolase family 127 protein [Clostridiales bacterium]
PYAQYNDAQLFWGNSETQSNWRDGYVRSAILLGEPEYLQETERYLNKIWATQDDGYLGIYDRSLRFHCDGENGELWAQSTLFRGLLACYEALDKPELCEWVCMAADRIMEGYPMGKSHPFRVNHPGAGVGHGLTVTDAFYWLYQITGEVSYWDYALWLYEEYSSSDQSEADIQASNVLDPNYRLKGHGVHTYEHIRALAIAAERDERYRPALNAMLQKLSDYLAPSGGPIGDECIGGRQAGATWTGYEFCSVHELLHTYSLLAELTGDIQWNERIEWLYYNAAEGMKHPTDSSIMYLKTDNCYCADEHSHPNVKQRNPRYKYSSTHQEAAVCCVPNSGRIIPYFIQSMLCRSQEGFVIASYGPYEYQSSYQNRRVSIRQETEYPFEMQAAIHIKVDTPTIFSVSLRMPSWAERMTINGRVYENPNHRCREISLRRVWREDTVTVTFEPNVEFHRDSLNDIYVSYGPLLYCVELPSQEAILRNLPISGFSEKIVSPVNRDLEHLRISPKDLSLFVPEKKPENSSWHICEISGLFYDGKNQIRLQMVPMARTILRKVTFTPLNSERQ